MKIISALLVFSVIAAATAASTANHEKYPVFDIDLSQISEIEDRNILINALVRQAIEYLRHIINNGSWLFGISPLDPFERQHFEIDLPLGLINLYLYLDNVHASGLGSFEVRKSELNLRDLTFDLDLVFPEFNISAVHYDFTGDLFTAIPLFGKGEARFDAKNFGIQGKLLLKQSEDQRSILVDRIENVSYQIPYLKPHLTGVIGGGEIDAIVNAIIEEVFVGYLLRFRGAISLVGATAAVRVVNPVLDQLDTWRFIAPLIPRA